MFYWFDPWWRRVPESAGFVKLADRDALGDLTPQQLQCQQMRVKFYFGEMMRFFINATKSNLIPDSNGRHTQSNKEFNLTVFRNEDHLRPTKLQSGVGECT